MGAMPIAIAEPFIDAGLPMPAGGTPEVISSDRG